jgi:hypothetical protein
MRFRMRIRKNIRKVENCRNRPFVIFERFLGLGPPIKMKGFFRIFFNGFFLRGIFRILEKHVEMLKRGRARSG